MWYDLRMALEMSSGELAMSLGERMVKGSGRLWEVREPEKAVQALEMMSCGVPRRVICKRFGISSGILARMSVDHGAAIDERKRKAAERAELSAEKVRLVFDEAVEKLDFDKLGEAVSPKDLRDLANAYKMVNGEAARLRGDATSIVEHKKGVSVEDAMKAIAEARARVKRVEVAGGEMIDKEEVVEVDEEEKERE